jgi:hypothetical protein
MMPGGHFVTSLALSAVAYGTTRSAPVAAGGFLGGFLIDADHYFDYIFIEKQWRKPWPAAFLRYYFESRFSLAVLPLHSWEVLALLVGLSVLTGAPLLIGYVTGALMHLIFDVAINGEHVLKTPVRFYSFLFRMHHRFEAVKLIEICPPANGSLNAQFWSVRHQNPETSDSELPD